MAPVIAALKRRAREARHVIVHTGQHYDPMMSQVFLQELGMPDPDYDLCAGSGSQAAQTARVMERIESVLEYEQPDIVIVPGDVNSSLAATLVAAKLGIAIAHIESGLRSFDRSMPEEVNRIVADQFADYLFLHSEDAVHNLRREGISDERMHFVGNTMIDTLVALQHRFRELPTAQRLGCQPGDYLLVTLHRPALVDGLLFTRVMVELSRVARRLPVVFPLHPRTRERIDTREPRPGVILSDPLGYLEFLSLEADAAAVLTDSGGVQEETTFLGTPCFTLRDNTERPVTVRAGTNHLLGLMPERIAEIPEALESSPRLPVAPPLWDGHAGERVAEVLASTCEQAIMSPNPAGSSSADGLAAAVGGWNGRSRRLDTRAKPRPADV
jgi:UDP-N-acetylglucosamine 2-epimerase (non-hydrolysing)